MISTPNKKAYLLLADGTVFEGYSMGAVGVTVGEVVFNTCTASYGEILSDPTYYGQIVAQTYPLVGNRGIDSTADSDISANGYIAREWSETDSGDGVSLHEYLLGRNIVGICGIDTRRLTRKLRDKGYFNGAITDSLDDMNVLLEKIGSYTISGAVEAVTCEKPYEVLSDEQRYRVVVIDYGFPRSMLAALTRRGCNVTVVPAGTSPEAIMKYKPDGVVYSDGPADPDDNPLYIENIKKLLDKKIPFLGIGLGHQMLALAFGGEIKKMPRGHRGSNQPVRNSESNKIMVTTQNHGYAVKAGSLSHTDAEVTMTNVNDGSVEGIIYRDIKGISVQFTPLDGRGYQDSAWIYDRFISFMKEAE